MRETIESHEITTLGEACLNWLVADPAELERFMSLAGYSPDQLRRSVGTRQFSEGLIDYFGRHEPLLLAMCANANISVERVMRAWYSLNPVD